MRRTLLTLLMIVCCTFVSRVCAQTVPASDSLIAFSDTLVADSFPEWHVAPEIPLFLRAPKHTAATACDKVAAIQTYDINSKLVEATYYEYDNAGRVISTTVWTHNADGSQTGKSKQEYSFDAYGNQVSTVVYDWDNTMNIWHGVSRYEYVYNAEQRMLSNTEYAWVNYAWAADTKYTWAYDAEGREAEYFSYKRNTTTNQLDPVNGFIYTWLSDTQKSLEIIYTAYTNGKWTAGTKKEWAFDGNGTQTMYATYTISNGAWIGSSKETWTYGGPAGEVTLYEKFGWANNNWSQTLKEETEYSGANIVRIENYTYANGVTTGTRREEYTYENNEPKQTIIYAWSNGMWIGSSNETWLYGGPSGQLTLHEKYEWLNNNWSITLKEETEYSGAIIVRIENYTYANGVPTGTKKELTTYSGGKKTQILTFAWENGAWVNSNKETWEFNGPSGKQTKHEKCEWNGSDWTIMVQENTIYDGNTTTIENYERIAGVWTGTKKEENTVAGGKKTETIIYAWDTDHWVELSKENWGYTSGKQTLHELYEWYNNNWSVTLRELATFDAAGNQTLIENYTGSEGVVTGTQKEKYAYTGSIKTSSIIYAWTNDDWVESLKEVWGFTSGKQTLYETYAWNGNWVKTLQENTTYDGENITKIENYALVEGVWAGTQKEEYTYTSGEKTRTIASVWAENDWVFSTKNEAGYWDGNVEISATNYAWNGSTWIGTGTRTKTTYDGTKVIEELTENWPSGATEWTNAAITTNTYNAEGLNILVYNGTWDGSRWVLHSMARLDIIKDAAGHVLLNASWTCGSDSIWAGVQKDTAAYTATNKPLYLASYKSWSNGNWVPYSKSEYTYDANDHQTLLMQYEGKNGVWVNKSRYENSYDSEGRELLKQAYTWSKNAWVGSYRYEYEYDADGNQTKYIQYKWSSGKWKGYLRTDKEYDSHGNVTMTISYDWYGNAWVGSSREDCVYDENNRLIESIQKEWDDEWINFRRTTNYYDNLGRNVSVRNYWWYNNEWALFKIEDKEYDLSSNILRRELSASWLNNELQSYVDKQYFYNCDPHFYTVHFVNYDGKVLAYNTQKEGQMPEYKGNTPTRPSTTESTFTFDGWTPSIVPVTSEATYIATFDSVKNSYIITWRNDDGTEIDHETLEYGLLPAHDDAVRGNTAEWTYTFSGWDPEVVSVVGDATYTAKFDSVKNNYTITWRNDDNSEIDHETLEFGVTPTHDDAVKDNTSEWTYTFSGWDPEVVSVVGDATYTAKFDSVKNNYTITWRNDDNSEIDHETLEFGVTPTHADATREATAEWTYTFTTWDPEIVDVVGDATYTAQFDSTKNSYTVTWLNADGSEIEHETLEYGATPEHADIVKEATTEWTYSFLGWEPEITTVTGDATYTAIIDSTKNSYTITWQNEDGSEIDKTSVEYGVVPTHVDPIKEATDEWTYNFTGWDPAVVAVVGEATYTAQFDSVKNTYTITWLNDDNSLIDQTTEEYGATPDHDDATKEATAEWTYSFSGWTPDIASVTGNAEYTATFSATKNKYTITFLNDDGTQLQSGKIAYGQLPEYTGAKPTKQATGQYTYVFSGWDPIITTVTGDATYTATYTNTQNQYTISWRNWDNSLIDQATLTYGAIPSHEDIERENTAEWTYTFAGWKPEVVSVIGDAAYTAVFDSVKNNYTVSWFNWDNFLIDQTTVPYGAVPTHENAARDNTDEWTYTFVGWDPDVVAVTGDAAYTAVFDSTRNGYTVSWLNWDNSLIDQTTVPYGDMPTHDDPSKQATAEWTYTFASWDPEIVSVTGDAVYTATYDSARNSYTITWLNDDGTEIDHETLEYGATPTHANPAKEATAQYTYTFAGWTPQVLSVTGEASYTATYSATVNTYTVIFYDEDGATVLDSREWEYGAMPECAEPTKEATAQYTYTFSGWTPEVLSVTGEASYTATYSATVNTYTIIFYDEDGATVLDSREWEYGAMPECAEPTKEATAQYTYTFAGWTPQVLSVTGEASYTATYSATVNTYTVIFYDEDGATVLDSREWEYGAMPEWEEPTKQPDGTHTYYFTGWTPEVVTVTSEATYTATFAADETNFGPDIIPLDENGNPIEWPVAHGTTIYLSADVGECQTFHWSDITDPADVHYKENPRPYVYEGVLPDFSAVIETIIYHISVNTDDAVHGEAILQELDRLTTSQAQELDITCGAWYELRATASDDWHFDHWSDGDTSSVRQVEASADMQYVAYFAANCGDYPSLPVVDLYDWLLMLDVRSIHALGYTFSEEDVVWYRVQGDPDKLNDSETADDIRVGTGYSFSLNESLINSGDYYAMVDVSSSPSGVLCTDMMRSKIIRFAASSDASAPALAPALVRPNEPQRLIGLDPDAPTVITIYDISGHLLRTLADDGVERMDLTAEAVPGCYQLVVQNGSLRTVLRYIVIK